MLFVALGGNELGLHGSREFLRHCPVPRDDIVAMINLDMIGRGRDNGLRIEGAGTAFGLRDLVAQATRESTLEIRLRDSVARRSDHTVFLADGIPSLLFHTGLHKQYHRPSDVASLIQVDAAVEVARLASRVVRKLADRKAPLRLRKRRK